MKSRICSGYKVKESQHETWTGHILEPGADDDDRKALLGKGDLGLDDVPEAFGELQ